MERILSQPYPKESNPAYPIVRQCRVRVQQRGVSHLRAFIDPTQTPLDVVQTSSLAGSLRTFLVEKQERLLTSY